MHVISASLLFLATTGLMAGTAMAAPASKTDDAATILAMEKAAMERWAKGDPDGFLEISDPEVVYFDPFTPGRLDGLDALRKLYDGLRGKVRVDQYEFINPKVELAGDMALLTFNFNSHIGAAVMRWNTTEVYRRRNGQWKIIHSHWSLTQPKLAKE
jgi:ketosteroid isomerase-like protein